MNYAPIREAVHEVVAAGLGVVAQSEVVTDARLISIRIRDVDLIMTEHVLCLRERRRLPVVQAFLSVARELRPTVEDRRCVIPAQAGIQ